MAENARPAKRQRGAKAAAQATLAQAAELEASPDDLVGGQTPSAAQAQPAKAHRPRVLVDVHSNGPVPGASGASQAVDDVENEYERQVAAHAWRWVPALAHWGARDGVRLPLAQLARSPADACLPACPSQSLPCSAWSAS